MAGGFTNALGNCKRALKSIFKRGKRRQGQDGEPSTATAAGRPTTEHQSAAIQPTYGDTNTSLPPIQTRDGQRTEDSLQRAVLGDGHVSSEPAEDAIQGHIGDARHERTVGDQNSPALRTAETSRPRSAIAREEEEVAQNHLPTSHVGAEDERLSGKNPAGDGPTSRDMASAPVQADSTLKQPPPTTGSAHGDGATDTAAQHDAASADQHIAEGPYSSNKEKIGASDELPPIKTVPLVSGMSATSGPLEDFTEAGLLAAD